MSKPTHEREAALREAAEDKRREEQATDAAKERVRQALTPWAELHGESSDVYEWIEAIAAEAPPALAVAVATMLDTIWRSYEAEQLDRESPNFLPFMDAANLRNRTMKELRPLLTLIDPRDELPDLLKVVVVHKSQEERAANKGPGLKVS